MDGYWLRSEMQELLRTDRDCEEFMYSNGWLHNFCHRWGITGQVQTEKNGWQLQRGSLYWRTSIAQWPTSNKTTSKLLIPPSYLWNSDHVVLIILLPDPSTWNFRYPILHMFFTKSKLKMCECMSECKSVFLYYIFIFLGVPCYIAASGLDKRQFTLHLTLRADGAQLMPPVLMFRGKGMVLWQW